MTRSAQSPAKTAKKEFRQNAKTAGIPFHIAIVQAKQALVESNKIEYPTTTRRNAGRGDGTNWNGDQFVCPQQCDGYVIEDDEDELHVAFGDDFGDDQSLRRALQIDDLFAIAKVGKQRKKDAAMFEMVRRPVSMVIALEEEGGVETDEEWEMLYSEEGERAPRVSYARAVQGQG